MPSINTPVLHVAPPRAMQRATLSIDSATTHATPNATSSLKALAYQVLERNRQRNTHATESKNICNFLSENATEKLHRSFAVSHADVKAACGDDWPEVTSNPHLFAEVTEALRTQLMQQQGIVPPHYTKSVECQHCGIVKLWEACPEYVLGCPWCLIC